MAERRISERARKLHADAFVWDNIFPFFDYYLFSLTMSGAQASRFDPKYAALNTFRDGGASVVGLTVAGVSTIEMTMRILATNLAFIRANPDDYLIVRCAADAERAKREGKLGLCFNFQGSDCLAGNIDMVAAYAELGVRQMLLCYNVRNAAGSGCHEATDDGLSAFGREVVREMNAHRMIVDASHTGYRTSMDLLGASQAPVIFSHSNPAALQAHPRNIADDQIKACAETGGVIGVVGFDGFLPGRTASVAGLADAIDHIVEVAGVDHVGLGLDWVYCEDMFRLALRANQTTFPSGEAGDYDTSSEFLSPAQLPEITQALIERGYRDDDIRKVLGENWLRVGREVWG